MKRKLKNLFNKRFLSGTLSAAMFFNMAAYLPMNVFADEAEAPAETVDLNEVSVNGNLISNGYLAVNVGSDSRFAIGTTGGNPDNSKDNNKKMLYGFPSGSTSYTTIRIDNTSYEYLSGQNEFNADEANNVSSAVYSDVNVEQKLTLVNNPATGENDLVEIKYIVTNEGEEDKNVGVRIMLDTMLGDNDSAPFRIPQHGAVTTETEYVDDEIPQFWQAFDNLTSPSVIAQGRIYQTEDERPDKVQFCNWRSAHDTNWNYKTTNGRGNGDSAVTMTWNEDIIAPSETKEYVTYYGLSEFTEDMSLPLGLSVYSDSELSVLNGQYAPNPVDVTAYVQNLSSKEAEDVKVSIELPENLTLTNDSEETIDIGSMTPNQLEQVSWAVNVAPSDVDRTYEYTVVLTAADGYEKRVSRSIKVPALQVEELSPYILFSGSDTDNLFFSGWKGEFAGDIYTGSDFISTLSELTIDGNIDAVNGIVTYGWKQEIGGKNENCEKEKMPDWDARILKMAEGCEVSNEDIVRIEDKNVAEGALRTTGNVEISGTTFEGNCYIIADGDIVYNVDEFKSTGKVLLYSRNGDIIINGSEIDLNGIMYAPNGSVSFNTYITNVNGRIFADSIHLNGSIFNVKGSDEDWELLGHKNVISKTYTTNADFAEGEFSGLCTDVADELTLAQREADEFVPFSKEYSDNETTDGITAVENLNKSAIGTASEDVDVKFDLKGFGSEEYRENNVDLVIAIDESWSMEWDDRMAFAKAAAKEIVAGMKPGDRCAVIGFSWTFHNVQELTSDKDKLISAIDNITYADGTDITLGINKSVDILEKAEESDNREKYIMLLSDGEDSTNSAAAATKAGEKNIQIFALSIVNDSQQMKTVANNSNGSYLFSPTAEQIGDMMNLFADEVFNNAGKDVNFSADIPAGITLDETAIEPKPLEITENADGSKTVKWFFDKITIDDIKSIKLPVKTADESTGIVTIAENIVCTYTRRNGITSRIHADDIVVPVHNYKESGSWTAEFDGQYDDTVWENVFWNGKLYDDASITVKVQAGNSPDAMGEWIEVSNHKKISGLVGRYVNLSVEMNVSSTGKTPELFDITVRAEGADEESYVNNAPAVTISGADRAVVGERVFLTAEAVDDAYCRSLGFVWSCDSEDAEISNADKPFAAVTFSKSGIYTLTLSVSDNGSANEITKNIVVYNEEDMIVPVIEIKLPELVKAGESVTGQIVNVNGTEITGYDVKAGGESVAVDANGSFTFTASSSDTITPVEAKAVNTAGLYGEATGSVVVDATAPEAELKADSNEIILGNTVVLSAFMSDSNGIKDSVLKINGNASPLTEGNSYTFTPVNAGKYTAVLTVTDKAGNVSKSEVVITVKEAEETDSEGPSIIYSVPRIILVNDECNFNFKAEDENGVDSIEVKFNGQNTALDADGNCSYTAPDKAGKLNVEVTAKDTKGNKTVFSLDIKIVSLSLTVDKTSYEDGEFTSVILGCSDNIVITDQLVTVDGVKAQPSDNTLALEGISAGTHAVIWQIEDESGAVLTASVNVVIEAAPVIDAVLSELNPNEDSVLEAVISASDEDGEIVSLTASLNGTPVEVNNNKIALGKLKAGEYTLEIKAVDNDGNYSVGQLKFTVFPVGEIDSVSPELDANAVLNADGIIEITASAVDNSGFAKVTATVNGENVALTDGKGTFNAQTPGVYKIIVRAEDAAGNWTEQSFRITVTAENPEYELKITVTPEKNNIKPNEEIEIAVTANTLLGNVSLNYHANGGNIKVSENGLIFSSERPGTFTITVTAEDSYGNVVEKSVIITVVYEYIDDDEEIVPYEKTVSVEPRARVLVKSDEPTETKISEEMAELADKLGTPLAVYEYLYNNLNAEYYIGSRKGAIGTYEQFGGNDVDCASLLIAMLRYMGYDAEYVTGQINMSEKQLMNYIGTDDIQTAQKIIMYHGRELIKSADTYYMNRTWVRTTINGETYDLDVNFKKYKKCNSFRDTIDSYNFDYDISSATDFSDIQREMNKYEGEAENIDISQRKLVQKAISELPSRNAYYCVKVDEEVKNISSSKLVTSDYLEISIGGEKVKINSALLNIASATIGYEPNEEFYDYFGDGSTPKDIYSLKNDYFASYGADTISPCLYLDNEHSYSWSALTKLGDTQDVYITSYTGKNVYTEVRKLLAGTLCSIVADTQNISPQSLLTVYERNNYSEEEAAKITESNFYTDEYTGDLLYMIGNAYFAQVDIQNKIFASTYDIYTERELSYGLITYNPEISEVSKYGLTSIEISKTGSIGLDIIGNYYTAISYKGDESKTKNFMFASGYVGSYLESLVIEQFTGIQSVSTAAVLNAAQEDGINVAVISSKNIDKIAELEISDKDKAAVKEAVEAGNYVTIPEKNVTINDWTGTAYIVADPNGTAYSFMLTDSLNGGYSTVDLVAYLLIDTICTGVDMYLLLTGMATAIAALLVPPLTILGAVAAVALTAFTVWAAVSILDSYEENVNLFFEALDGDVDAANQLNKNAFFAFLFTAATPLINGACEAVGGKIVGAASKAASKAKNSLLRAVKWHKLAKLGIADDILESIFKAGNWASYSDDVLRAVAESGQADDIMKILAGCSDDFAKSLSNSVCKEEIIALIGKYGDDAVKVSTKCGSDIIKTVAGLSDDAAKAFIDTAAKGSDDFLRALNLCGNIDDAVKFVADYTDDAVELITKYGDDAVVAVKLSGSGKTGVEAIMKYGDDAINALEKVQTTQCADLILDYGDDAAKVIYKYGDDAVKVLDNYGNDGLDIIDKSIDKDAAVSKLNSDIAYRDANGKAKGFRLTLQSDTYPNSSNFNVSDRINHSNVGDYSAYKNPKDPSKGGGNIKGGCHGQDGMDELKRRGIQYNVEVTYENGVRAGNIPSISDTNKSTGIGQAWFPETWTAADIEAAGVSVMKDRSVVIAYVYDGKITGYEVYGIYNEVTVGVITDVNGEMTSKIGTIFPDNLQRALGDIKQ